MICYIYLKQVFNISNLALPEVRKLVDGDGKHMWKALSETITDQLLLV